jgi:gliding motility-associated-like protein
MKKYLHKKTHVLLILLAIIGISSKVYAQDVGVSAITSPANNCGAGAQIVTITISNYGTAVVGNIPVNYSLDAGAVVSETCPSGNLAPGATLTYSFTTLLTIPQGMAAHSIVSCSALGVDINSANNCFTKTNIFNYPAIANNIISTSQTICSGSIPAGFTGTAPTGGNNSYSYQWEISTTSAIAGFGDIAGATASTYTSPALTQTTWFRRRTTSIGVCTPNESTAIQITVNPTTVGGTTSGAFTVCANSNSGSVSLSGNTGTVIKWQSSIDGGGTWNDIANTSTTQAYSNIAVTTMYRVVVQSGVCPTANSSVTTITVDPTTNGGSVASDATVCSGTNSGTVTLSGQVGAILNWEQSTNNGVSWLTISNTTTSQTYNNLSISTLYRAVLKSGTCSSANSSPATITVSPTSVGGSISGGTTVCSGTNSGTLTLSGQTGSVIQWESSTDGGTTWVIIANTTNTLNFNNLTTTTIYRSFVKSGACSGVYSSTATVIVDATSTGGNTAGAATVCSGSNSGTITVSGQSGTILRWEFSTDGGSTWNNISNTTASQLYTNLNTTTDYRVISQGGVCTAAQSSITTITVNPVSVGGSIAGSASVCITANTGTLTLSGQVGNILSWEYSTNGGASWTAIANTSTTQNYTNLTQTTQYRADVQSGVCAATTSSIATISVDPTSVGGTISGSATVCTNSNSGSLTLTGQTGNILFWEYSTDGGISWTNISNTSNTQNYFNITQTTQYRAQIKSGTCSTSISSIATITVDPATVPGTTSGSATVCSGSNSGTLILSGQVGSITNWESSTDGGITWSPIANTTTSQPYNNIATNTLYRAVVKSGTCSSSTSSMSSITVNPASVGGTISGSSAACATSNSGTLTLSGQTGSVLRWESSTDGGSSWTVIANTTTSQAYNNLTVTTIYRAIIQSGSCPSTTSSTATITIVPATIGGSISGSASVCAGTNNGTLVLNGNVGSVIQWEYSTDGGSTWNIIANTTTSQSYNNISAPDRIYRALVKSGSCTSAYSSTATITVTSSVVAGKVVNDALVCRGANSGVLTLVGQAGTIVRWESSNDGTTWNPIGNTTTSQNYLNITNTTQYRVAILDCGGGSSFSDPATIVVDPSPVAVGGNVLGSVTVCYGTNSGSLTLNGQTGHVTSWELSVDGGASWATVNDTTTTLNYSNITVSTQYRALVKSGVCNAVPASPAIVGTNPVSVGGTVSGSTSICVGINNGTLKLTGYTGSVLNWESSTDGGTTWSTIANTSSTLAYNNLNTTTIYHAIVQSGVCSPATSSNATISTDMVSKGGTITGNATVCSGNNGGTLKLNGYLSNILRWEYSIDNGNTWIAISNNTDSLIYQNLTVTTQYRAIAQSGSCSAAISTIATISVDQKPVGGITKSDASVCAGNNSGTITLSAYSGTIINWEASTDGGTTWVVVANASASLTYSNLNLTTIYRAVIGNGTCATVNSSQTTITIIPASIGGRMAGSGTVCINSNSGSLIVSSYTGNIIRWESSTDGGTTWVSLGNTTDTQNYLNVSTKTFYRAVVQNNSCSIDYSAVGIIDVTAVDVQGTILSDATVCPNNNNGILTVIGNVGAIQYWQSSVDGGATWTNIANTTRTLVYNNISQTTRYRAFSQGCGATPLASTIATILVDNSPAAVGGSVSGTNSYCGFINSGNLVLSGYTGNIISWESSTDGGTSWAAITNTTNTQTFTNLTTTTYFRANVKSGVCNAVASSPAIISIVPTTVAGTITGAKNECASANAGVLTVKGYVGNILHWETSTDGGATWTIVANTTDTISYKNLTDSVSYRALVENGFCAMLLTPTVSVNVAPVAVGGTISGSATACPGSNNGTLSLSGETGTILNWQFSTDGGNTWINTSNTTHSQNYNNLIITTAYRAIINSGVCGSIFSSIATITINSTVVGGSISGGGGSVCPGINSGALTLSGENGVILNWESSIDNGLTWTNIPNTTNTLTYTNITTTTIYRAIIKQTGICSNTVTSNISTVYVYPAPIVDFSTSSPTPYAGEAILFTNNTQITSGNLTYTWNFGDNSPISVETKPTHIYAVVGTYTVVLTATSGEGCIGKHTKALNVTIDTGYQFIIPNLLTLNDNGLNDTWIIDNIENYPNSEATIYDGYGTIIFQASPYLNNWDGTYKGKKLPDGTYYYVLKIKDLNKSFKGTINIIK